MGEPLLHLEKVKKSFGDGVVTPVLHGVDLSLGDGEFAALVGPSGSGKSTLLNIMGLLDRPTSGTIKVTGTDISTLDDEQLTGFRGRTIGFVFQFHHLLHAFTSLENVMLPMMADKGRADEQMRKKALALLGEVGLSDRVTYRTNNLSGGQQQRVAIARALAMNPRLVLADEPTGNLDTQTSAEILKLLRRINRERNTAFLVVTHDQGIAAGCDRVIELVDGLVKCDRRSCIEPVR
jgi:lipoprotein-releasing system ATP-binding protein